MGLKKSLLLRSFSLAVGAVALSVSTFAIETSYYYGKMSTYNLDGSFVSAVDSLVKRDVNREKKEITETTIQPSRDPRFKPTPIVTRITQIDGNIYRAVDVTKHSFDGTMTFLNEYTDWTYALDLSFRDQNGVIVMTGFITGRGSLVDKDGIVTQKILSMTTPASDDRPATITQYKVEDHLPPISEADYVSKKNEMLGI